MAAKMINTRIFFIYYNFNRKFTISTCLHLKINLLSRKNVSDRDGGKPPKAIYWPSN